MCEAESGKMLLYEHLQLDDK